MKMKTVNDLDFRDCVCAGLILDGNITSILKEAAMKAFLHAIRYKMNPYKLFLKFHNLEEEIWGKGKKDWKCLVCKEEVNENEMCKCMRDYKKKGCGKEYETWMFGNMVKIKFNNPKVFWNRESKGEMISLFG